VNHNGLDNRRCNLRFCTPQQNMGNKRAKNALRGVFPKNGKFFAQIGRTHLGSFASATEAAAAYDRAANERYGEFAILNFPDAVAA